MQLASEKKLEALSEGDVLNKFALLKQVLQLLLFGEQKIPISPLAMSTSTMTSTTTLTTISTLKPSKQNHKIFLIVPLEYAVAIHSLLINSCIYIQKVISRKEENKEKEEDTILRTGKGKINRFAFIYLINCDICRM